MPLTRRAFVRTLFVASQTAVLNELLPRSLFAATPAPGTLNFAVIGDWGHPGPTDQPAVAHQMGIACQKASAKFVISVGDNFYNNGVTSVTDPRFQQSFENIYTAPSLQVPWYLVLGNHDYNGNCDAQIAYSKTNKRWNMPARYYSKVHDVDAETKVEIFHIDTCPMVIAYQNDLKMKDIRQQDTKVQLAWLNQALAASTAPWKLVVGHHPIYSSGLGHGTQPELVERVLPLLEKHKVQAYFAGHDHDLEHLQTGTLNLFISGGGFEHRPMRDLPQSKFADPSISGFAMASLSANELNISLVDSLGNTIYSTSVPRVS